MFNVAMRSMCTAEFQGTRDKTVQGSYGKFDISFSEIMFAGGHGIKGAIENGESKIILVRDRAV